MSDPCINDNLRAEYEALSSYERQVVTFRFTVLSFFLATVGIIVFRAEVVPGAGLVLIFLSVPMWLLDARNRVLLKRLGERGKAIEKIWENMAPHAWYDGYSFHRHAEDNRCTDIQVLSQKVPFRGESHFGKLARHSLAIDLICILTAFYGLMLYNSWLFRQLSALVVFIMENMLTHVFHAISHL